ncbi:2OG-Fe dioxygenase family protein, partial [Streptomyces sp. NPDC059564]|uniref:2OG-Fe dioxygenase family protein n=1 Tax=Streptomyces sp. NPDC059564 TaxID=3346865 RepID=UPI0036CCE299
MSLGDKGYAVMDTPPLDEYSLAEFENLPLDPYTGSTQRYRRFSQFRLVHEDRWTLELLPHRHFAQPRQYNDLVGGRLRTLEPLTTDPTPLIAAGAEAMGLDKDTAWQLNIHQCRVVSTPEVEGVAAPEGPHRDGHQFGIVAVTRRHNISGGETQLMPLGGGEPFFRTTRKWSGAPRQEPTCSPWPTRPRRTRHQGPRNDQDGSGAPAAPGRERGLGT